MISHAILENPALVSFLKTSTNTRPSARAILRSLKNSLVYVFSKLHLKSRYCLYLYMYGYVKVCA